CPNTLEPTLPPTHPPPTPRQSRTSSPPYKGANFTLLPLLHENSHYFVCEEHASARQRQARAVVEKQARIDKRRQICAVSFPDIDAIPAANCLQIDTGGQTKTREEDISEAFRGIHAPDFRCHGYALRHTIDVLVDARHVLRPDAADRSVRAAPEAEPLAVSPVFQVVPRLAHRLCDIGYLILPIARGLQPL